MNRVELRVIKVFKILSDFCSSGVSIVLFYIYKKNLEEVSHL